MFIIRSEIPLIYLKGKQFDSFINNTKMTPCARSCLARENLIEIPFELFIDLD